jgi:DNA-binding PadR family transcriptional regulator
LVFAAAFDRANDRLRPVSISTRPRRIAVDILAGLELQSLIDISIIEHEMPKRKLDPLPSTAFQILLSLAGNDLHGYGIMRAVEEHTNGRMRLGPGTLYSSIQALLEEGMIEEVEGGDESEAGHERRRYYRLTMSGKRLARSEAERLADLLRVARIKRIFRGEYV